MASTVFAPSSTVYFSRTEVARFSQRGRQRKLSSSLLGSRVSISRTGTAATTPIKTRAKKINGIGSEVTCSASSSVLPSALLFDCDGVLVDTERDGHRISFNDTFAEVLFSLCVC